MAVFRKIHTSFWSDPFTSELDSEKKLFYLYLLTNEKTKQCGIYEISKKQICFDTGYNINTVSKLLEYFIKNGKIMYSESTNEIAIKNWVKYNYSTSPKVVTCIQSELKLVKNRVLIEYQNGIDTLSQEEKEEEQEEEETKEENINVSEKIDFEKLQNYWNSKCKNTLVPEIKVFSKVRQNKIKTLVNEYGKDEIIKAINKLFESDFCLGKKTNWIANFDFLCQQSSFIKLIEGSYSNNNKQPETPKFIPNPKKQTSFGAIAEIANEDWSDFKLTRENRDLWNK